MTFAYPDPKRVEADRKRIEQRHLDDIRAIERERQIKQEIRACYYVGEQMLNGVRVVGYSPAQIAQAGEMMACNHLARRLAQNPTFERIGRSRGGKRKGNLYVCRMVVQ